MAIKPFPDSIPSELPPAKLYLDDIGEILQILTDSGEDCQASFVVGKSKCDTLDDLKDLRGRTTRFVLNISSPGKHQTLEAHAIRHARTHPRDWGPVAGLVEICKRRRNF